ncbi:hypothetical protein L1887_41830 [Cichorium endivia]|nr:hypothetical protein L1887_41830 [Cichorium endivia]
MWVPPSYMNTESKEKEKEKENHSNDHVLKPTEPSKPVGNGEIEESGNGTRFPFPIFWLPYKNNEVKKEDNLDEKTRKKDEAESENSGKHGVQKVISVKQLGAKDETKTENGKEEKKVSQKTTKLPPVCLRIDPLPKKKKNSSRSPSPPGEKERSKRSTTEDSKSFKQQTESTEGLKNINQEQHVVNATKEVLKDRVVDSRSEKGVEQDRSSEVESSKVEIQKKLSGSEAAVMIQSVYRGFEVRKSQPLMKLKQISDVRKQVVELRNRVQDLESSIDNKQKLVISETIMSLLLKLDTIQGLHPIVRDVRKSVAKELVSLQEKLDSLTFVKSETLSEEPTCSTDSSVKFVENNEVEATESQGDDGGENCSTGSQPQVESQNEENTGEINSDQIPTVDDPVDHEKAQSDRNDLDLEDNEVEVTDPVHDMKPEQLVEQSSGELNNDQVQMAVETEQSVDGVIQEKSDQAQSESGTNVETVESENGGGTEARVMNLEEQVESEGQQTTVELTGTNDQVQVVMEADQPIDDVIQEKSDVGEHDGGTEARVINLEPQLELEGKQSVVELNDDQLEVVEETAPPEDSDQRQALIFKNVDSMEDVTTATTEVETDVGTMETRELGKEDEGNRVQEDLVDDVNGGSKEVLVENPGGAQPHSATGSHVSSGGDKKLMEENEKLRAAVEELMKAGSEQVSLIRELTGRVKDLEKELLKKKRRKVKKSCRRPRGSVVEEELRSCA